jgi:hypothetical protein
MTEEEAIALLAGCRPLAQALEKEEFDYPLTEEDLLHLADFKRVWLTNLATRSDIVQASGLTLAQLLWLAHLLSAQETKKLKELYRLKSPAKTPPS